jgi:hypothetical protein
MSPNTSSGAAFQIPTYRITRDGFTWLAMRFRGKKALALQIAYSDAFKAMATLIQNQRKGLTFRWALHDLACKDSQRRGSFHGKGLNARKQEIPLLQAEDAHLRALSQPKLPGFGQDAVGADPDELPH